MKTSSIPWVTLLGAGLMAGCNALFGLELGTLAGTGGADGGSSSSSASSSSSSSSAGGGAGGAGGGGCVAFEVPPSGSTAGEYSYSTVTIKMGGKLKVNAFDSVKKTGGVLHLRSNKIVIEAGASIDASAAGYAGVDEAKGEGPGAGKAGGANLPGGGGAFFGSGGEGTNSTCVVDTMMLGGAPYADSMKIDFANPMTLFGSAGGAAGIMSQGTGGGRGGGAVILEAAEIDLGGTLLANGADGTASVGMVGSGGGAGGLIMLITNNLVLGPAASISAHGGNGGAATLTNESGGGGGGGLVVINVTKQTGMVTPVVSAGHSGTCAGIVAGPGATMPGVPPGNLGADGGACPPLSNQ